LDVVPSRDSSSLRASAGRETFAFGVAPGRAKAFFVRFTLDPSVIGPPEQLFGW
jgi:hypothetical protein